MKWQQLIRSYTVVEVDGKMAGFTATHIHLSRLAEVRSLVVGKDFRGLKLVKTCRCLYKEAKQYGIQQLLSLTYEQGFLKVVEIQVITFSRLKTLKMDFYIFLLGLFFQAFLNQYLISGFIKNLNHFLSL